jgi:hypothetical protein
LMKQAGAICYAIELGVDVDLPPVAVKQIPAIARSADPAPISSGLRAPTTSSLDNKASNSINNKTRQAISQGASNATVKVIVKEESWSLAPVGSILVEPNIILGVEIPDIDGISLADVGSIIIEHREPPHFKVTSDLSKISLAPVGSNVVDSVEHHYPKPPDVSGIKLAALGSDVVDPAPKIPGLRVNISHISLE